MKKQVPLFPKRKIDYVFFIVDKLKDDSVHVDFEPNPKTFERYGENFYSQVGYIRQYITYLIFSNFIEMGKYRVMGSLTMKNKNTIELNYSVCKRVRKTLHGDDVWEENITKTFKNK